MAVFPFDIVFLIASLMLVEAAIVPFDQWAHQRVALKDVNIHFRYSGTGPPILLVHGFPEHSVTKPLFPLANCLD